jgi:hypothetical protein
MNDLVLGAIVMACSVIGLFFLRFWRRSGDRLFAIFAIAFWVLGLNWLALALTQQDELRTALYGIRFLAFLLIVIGIVDKNRSSHAGRRGASSEMSSAMRDEK